VVPDPGLTQGPTRTEFTERQQGVELRLTPRGPSPDPELEAAWRRLEDSAGRLRIGELQADTGWSRRRLADRFRQQLGLTPKALACGYYDQAHLNREFRALAGCTPTDYVRGAVTNIQDFGAGPS
jgi:AraC-like DNA-binding protein